MLASADGAGLACARYVTGGTFAPSVNTIHGGRLLPMRKLSWIPTVTIVIASLTLDGVVPDVLSAADATYYVLQDKTGKHRIVYEMANMLGKSQFTYNDHIFSGSEIRRKSVTDLGETISVTLNKGKDGDSTTLTLVLPRVVVEQDSGTKIRTLAVSTFHRNHATGDHNDQREVYNVINLIGLALSGPPPESKK